MEQPESAKEPGNEDWACHLNKSLYSLLQASCQWSKKLHACLTKEGFTCCVSEHSIFTCSNLGMVTIAVHVDDMPVTASSPSVMIIAKAMLQKYFKIIDLRPVKWLLGICIEHDCANWMITLSQMAHINSIVTQFKLEDGFKVKTWM